MPNSRQNLRAHDGTPIVVIDEESGGEEELRGALRSSSLIIRRKLVPPVWYIFNPWRRLREGGNYCTNRSVSLSITVVAPRLTDFELGRLSHHPPCNHRVIASTSFHLYARRHHPQGNPRGATIATESLNSEFLHAKLLPFLALHHEGARIPSLFLLIFWPIRLYLVVTDTPRLRGMMRAEPLVSPMSSKLFEHPPSLGGNSRSSHSDETVSPSM